MHINELQMNTFGNEKSPNNPGDAINHPKHYNLHPSGVECIDIVQHHNFCIGNAIKYIWRSGLKGSKSHIEDLKKAKWYIEREIHNLENKVYERN